MSAFDSDKIASSALLGSRYITESSVTFRTEASMRCNCLVRIVSVAAADNDTPHTARKKNIFFIVIKVFSIVEQSTTRQLNFCGNKKKREN